MKIKNKILYITLLFTIIFTFINTSFATDSNNNVNTDIKTDLNLYCKSCILIECSTNKIAYEKQADTVMYPASTTKILTAILALEKCNLTDIVTITPEMVSQIPAGYTTAYLKPGEQLTVEQLLNCLLVPSANDAGYALAIHISGSIENFSKLMNEKAKEIGCTNSNFTNPSGIHNSNHYSTAKDMAIIGMYSLRYPQITNICSQTSYTLQTSQTNTRTFETTNTLLKNTESNYYEYATGLKTGFTSPAGSCIIATAQKDNIKFLAVVLGAPEPQNNTSYRDIDCKTLFEYGFLNYENIVKVDEKITNFLNNSFISGLSISTIFKFAITICILYFAYVVISIRKNHKFSEKTNNSNELEEFNFRCSFW